MHCTDRQSLKKSERTPASISANWYLLAISQHLERKAKRSSSSTTANSSENNHWKEYSNRLESTTRAFVDEQDTAKHTFLSRSGNSTKDNSHRHRRIDQIVVHGLLALSDLFLPTLHEALAEEQLEFMQNLLDFFDKQETCISQGSDSATDFSHWIFLEFGKPLSTISGL